MKLLEKKQPSIFDAPQVRQSKTTTSPLARLLSEPKRHIFLIDTREQLPYTFRGHAAERIKIPAGDYSVHGFSRQIAVERKTLDDYLGSITHERTRFFNEIATLSRCIFKCIVVEATWADIVAGSWEKKTNPKSVIATTIAIEQSYGVPVHFLSDRESAIVFVEQWLQRAGEQCTRFVWGIKQ